MNAVAENGENKIYVLKDERRQLRSDRRIGNDRRSSDATGDNAHSYWAKFIQNEHRKSVGGRRNPDLPNRRSRNPIPIITRDSLDYLIELTKWRMHTLIEVVQDKEKKKLGLLMASFAVFSLLTTVSLGLFSAEKISIKDLYSPVVFTILFVFLVGVTAINTSLIKHIIGLKSDCLIFLRQMNCLRQSLHVLTFARVENYLPLSLLYFDPPQKENDVSKWQRRWIFMPFFLLKYLYQYESPTIHTPKRCDLFRRELFQADSNYLTLYGKHEKLPLDNDTLRNAYNEDEVIFESADIFSVLAIGFFTALLLIAPCGFYMITALTPPVKYDMAYLALGSGYLLCLLVFLVFLSKTISLSINKTRKQFWHDLSGIADMRKRLREECGPKDEQAE